MDRIDTSERARYLPGSATRTDRSIGRHVARWEAARAEGKNDDSRRAERFNKTSEIPDAKIDAPVSLIRQLIERIMNALRPEGRNK